jgi:hypothetical protein
MHSLFEYWLTGRSHYSSIWFHVSLIYTLTLWILVDWPVPLLLYTIPCQPDLYTRCLNTSYNTELRIPISDTLYIFLNIRIRRTECISCSIVIKSFPHFSVSFRRSDTFASPLFDSGNTYTMIPSSEYYSADLIDSLTVYNPPDIRWDVLTGTMSQYYLC